ncbi:hypothetical protein EMIHUDRAFT_457782 [Emiliania huxleyi CCMP1516]|uniref:Uncharacterized protein n=2 Tax=Emiliania huxleyi TaxID=2903 RepID=A0A0D3JLC7_EMIH1|nr:hypothetical protein EMIHUDRAFT_457782 [Emiliania huxleyi CCMP1516]EOD24312.1 hypothetical protein EMIHUDRAFT_457782 [Emiliania huxleyi CCMP1516]|eukprot:XP_005776741.1 hypothetical protein EMIHUDRAFT_457782 [Emiliania huxleyi CCMP1516]
MCERTVSDSCQESHFCGEDESHECLPSWKFDDAVTQEVGTGSAPDGDEDAILGMLLLVLATQSEAPRPPWWGEVAQWAYQSCRAFLQHLSVDHPTLLSSNGRPLRMLKLGSCWGGWDCNNPSYHAPGHYRAFRDYMLSFAASYGATASEGADLAPVWDSLVETSHALLREAQCDASGLVPNWWVPADGNDDVGAPGTPGCGGSGTEPAEFGAEASRTAWRVGVDALWYGSAEAASFLRPMAAEVEEAVRTDYQLSSGCWISSVLSDWQWIGFMAGPVTTSLLVPAGGLDPSLQQAALDDLGVKIQGMPVNDYYSGSWVAIATATMLECGRAGICPESPRWADPAELHEVRCCSDTAIGGPSAPVHKHGFAPPPSFSPTALAAQAAGTTGT